MSGFEAIKDLLLKYPKLSSTLIGAGVGGPVGYAFSDYGEEPRGSLQGAILGGVSGLAGGAIGRAAQAATPTPAGALVLGGTLGGSAGGMLGRRQLSPWMLEQIKANMQDKEKSKEASVNIREEIQKEAELVKEADEQTLAFDFGMEVFLKEAGMDKAEVAKLAGLQSPDKLAGASIQWLSERIKEAPKA